MNANEEENGANTNLSQNPPQAKKMRWIIWGSVIFLVILIGLCWYFYAEPYLFWQRTVSDLGMWATYEFGNPNPVSRIMFTTGFILLGIALLTLDIMYIKNTGFYAKTFKIVIVSLMALGAVLNSCPYDSRDHVSGALGEIMSVCHYIGAALFVGGFGIYNFICQLLRYIRKKKSGNYPTRNFDFWLDLIFAYLVFFTILWYIISGLLGLFDVDKTGWLAIFDTAISQKIVLIVAGFAAFLLDPEDI